MKEQYVISIMSHDGIGIVQAVSHAINEMGGEIADLRQSVLRGYFTMILLAAFDSSTTAPAIRERLARVRVPGIPPLEVSVIAAADDAAKEEANPLANAYVLTASGAQQAGLVAKVSALCAENGINILDLSTAVAQGRYIMILIVDPGPLAGDIGQLHHKLERFGAEHELTLVLQHYDVFRATNEVGIR